MLERSIQCQNHTIVKNIVNVVAKSFVVATETFEGSTRRPVFELVAKMLVTWLTHAVERRRRECRRLAEGSPCSSDHMLPVEAGDSLRLRAVDARSRRRIRSPRSAVSGFRVHVVHPFQW